MSNDSPFKSTLKTKQDFDSFTDYNSGDSVILCAIGAKLCEIADNQYNIEELLRQLIITRGSRR